MIRTRQHRLSAIAGAALGGVLLAASAAAAAAPAHLAQRHGLHHTQVGKASYYGPHHAGKTMANGRKMRPGKMIAASPTLPLGTKAKVTNLENGKSVAVTVADRGPYAKDRILDVSTKAADKLDMKEDGVAPVKVQPLEIPKTESPEGGTPASKPAPKP